MEKNRNYDLVIASFFLAVGMGFSIYARSIEIGTWHNPGPGFFPFWAGIVLAGMSIVLLLLRGFRKKPTIDLPPFFPEKDSWKRVLTTFLALLAFNLGMQFIGFTVISFLFLAFLLRFVFPQNWKRTLVIAALGSAITRLVFIHFLEVQLPKGIFGL